MLFAWHPLKTWGGASRTKVDSYVSVTESMHKLTFQSASPSPFSLLPGWECRMATAEPHWPMEAALPT